MIHRDVKPSNIWLEGPTEHVRLLDFGLARPVDDTANPSITASGTVLGTPAYMSPEQAVSQKVDARADLFSLGVVLYEMSTGNRPFAGASTLSVMQALATVRPAIPGVLSELIEGLLVKDPEARHPQSAAELVENFKLIEAGQEPPPLRRRVVTKKSNRWRLRAGLAVLVPLILVVGYQVLNATSAGTGTTVPVDPFKVAVEKFEMTVLPQLKNKPLKFTSEDDDSNGTVAAKRTTYWRYTGQTGIPRLNVENDHIILQIPYIGQCNRKAYEFGILAAQQTEASRGNLVVKLRFKEDRFHIASMRREQASGEQEKAELAIEQLLRQVMQ